MSEQERPRRPGKYQRLLFNARQLAFTEALMACEGIALRFRKTSIRGMVALECANLIAKIRDTEAAKWLR